MDRYVVLFPSFLNSTWMLVTACQMSFFRRAGPQNTHKKNPILGSGSGILSGFTCFVLRGKVRDCQAGGCATKAAHGISEIDTWHLFSLTHLLRRDFVFLV